MTSVSRRVVHDFALTIIALVFSGLVPLGFNLLVGRSEGPAALGQVSVTLGLALFLGQIPGAFCVAATKFIAVAEGRGQRDEAQKIFQFLLVLTLGVVSSFVLVLVVTAPRIASALHTNTHEVLLAAAFVVVYALYLFIKSVYYGVQQVNRYVVNEIASDLLFFGLLGIVLVLHASPWLLLPFVANNLMFVVIGGKDLRRYLSHFDWSFDVPRKTIVTFCVLTGSGTAASLGRWSLGTVIAGLYVSHEQVGQYAAALAIANPLYLMPQALSLVLFATMSRLHGSGAVTSVRELLERSTECLSAFLGLGCGLVAINAHLILTLAFSGHYQGAERPLQLVILGAYCIMVAGPSISALSSDVYMKIPVVAGIAGLLTSIFIWITLVPHIGIDGCGLGYAIGTGVSAVLPAAFAVRLLRPSVTPFIQAAAIVACLVLILAFLAQPSLLASALFLSFLGLLYARRGIFLVHRLRGLQRFPATDARLWSGTGRGE